MDAITALLQRRTIRLYQQTAVTDQQLLSLIEAAVNSPVAINSQTLSYAVIRTPETVRAVLAETGWAAMVKPKRTPVWGETAPAAFIAVLAPAELAASPFTHANAGAAIQSILTAAYSEGLGTCWIGSVQKPHVQEILSLDASKEILYLVSVGYPAEQPVRDDIAAGDSQKYYLDAAGTLHVPKLPATLVTSWF